MCQETENGIFKPVLGALGVASVFLTIVGHFAFSPRSSLVPTLEMTGMEQAPQSDLLPDGEKAVEQASVVEPVPQPRPALQAELAPKHDETIAKLPVELPISPHQTVNDDAAVEQIPLAALEPLPEPATKTDSDGRIVSLPAELPKGPQETAGDVLVAEKVPEAEPAQPIAQAPKTEESVVTLPVERPVVPHETVLPEEKASDVSVANVWPEPEATPLYDSQDPQPRTVADADASPPVDLSTLSHHDRKILRKVAHLEKKKTRLARHVGTIACR